jgi:hypothetical protein
VSPAQAAAFIPAVVRDVVETASTTVPVTVRVPWGLADPASVPPGRLAAVVSGLSRVG